MPILARTGNEAMAEAMRQINPDVVAAYPITPATEIVMIFSKFVADGLVDTEFVAVESEHSAMSATLGAASAGIRAMTATSSQGLALMSEILPIVSALRLPIVMPEVNRALSGPINIHCDHSDTMAMRDYGWLQIFCENSQEAYDSVLQAIRISEHADVQLPSMVTTDGFIISHGMERVDVLEDNEAKDFVGQRKASLSTLDIDNPKSFGCLDLQDYYFEHKMPIEEAMAKAKKVILDIGKEFEDKTGRGYGFFEAINLDDAEAAIVCLGSTAGTAKAVVKEMRSRGKKVGLLKIRIFRPFAHEEVVEALQNVKNIAVLDRSGGFGSAGAPLFTEIRSALYGVKNPPKVVGFIYGLGGREITMQDIEGIYNGLLTDKYKDEINYLGVRE